MRVLITGAAGFAGAHLRALLEARGDETVPLAGDIRDLDSLTTAIGDAQPDAIAHLAGLASVAQAWDAERTVWDVNATGTVNVLMAARDAAADARLLIVSSAEVYGAVPEKRLPITEDETVAPLSPYGVSKAAAELAARQSPLDVAIVRPFNHFGPGQDTRFAIPSFCAQIAAIERGQQAPQIGVGNLSTRRDLSDVRDVVGAYALLLRPGVRRGRSTSQAASRTSSATCSSACSSARAYRSRSWSTSPAYGRRTCRSCAAMPRACARRSGGSPSGTSSRRSSTRSSTTARTTRAPNAPARCAAPDPAADAR